MRTKLKRYTEIANRENILEPGKELYESIKGKWRDYFDNNNPIVVELGCGRGEYSIQLAQKFSDKNFIGIDIKGDRLWVGSTNALELELENVAFLRTHILELDKFFEVDEVSEIWITFPDPRPKERDSKRRLTSPRFMGLYQKVLNPKGWIKLKTDSTSLFEYTVGLIQNKKLQVSDWNYTFDLYESEFYDEHFGIKTKYENIFTEKGEKIKYMKFKFK